MYLVISNLSQTKAFLQYMDSIYVLLINFLHYPRDNACMSETAKLWNRLGCDKHKHPYHQLHQSGTAK